MPINYVGHAEQWDEVSIDGDIQAKDCLLKYEVVLPPKKEFENLCAIYKGNCGKVGLLTAIAASEIVAFYSCALSLSPQDPAGNGCRYDAKNVTVCIALGKRIQSTLASMELD